MLKLRPIIGLLMLAVLSACGAQHSMDATQPVSLGVGVGTMGLVVEPSVKTGHKTALRAPVGFGTANTTTTVDGIDYDVSGSVGGVGLLADYYPSAGSFRVSGGLFKTNLKATGRATGNVEVGSNTYVGVDVTTSGKPDNTLAPVIALGFNGHVGGGWGLSTDLGVMYVGGFTATATDAAGIVSQADLDAEMSAVNDELKDLSILPFVKFGATYRW